MPKSCSTYTVRILLSEGDQQVVAFLWPEEGVQGLSFISHDVKVMVKKGYVAIQYKETSLSEQNYDATCSKYNLLTS